MAQVNACGIKIAASFVLPEHSAQLEHFKALFGSRYAYRQINLCGVCVVDCIKIDDAFRSNPELLRTI